MSHNIEFYESLPKPFQTDRAVKSGKHWYFTFQAADNLYYPVIRYPMDDRAGAERVMRLFCATIGGNAELARRLTLQPSW